MYVLDITLFEDEIMIMNKSKGFILNSNLVSMIDSITPITRTVKKDEIDEIAKLLNIKEEFTYFKFNDYWKLDVLDEINRKAINCKKAYLVKIDEDHRNLDLYLICVGKHEKARIPNKYYITNNIFKVRDLLMAMIVDIENNRI